MAGDRRHEGPESQAGGRDVAEISVEEECNHNGQLAEASHDEKYPPRRRWLPAGRRTGPSEGHDLTINLRPGCINVL